MDEQYLEELVSQLPEVSQANARQNLPYIVAALDTEGILTPKVLAYAIATVQHESGFQPKEETMAQRGINARNDYIANLQDNYGGGRDFHGRGYIQLTHKSNYEKYGQRIGEDLVNNPQKLLEPETSAKVLAAYMKDAGVAEAAEQGDLTTARIRVQGRGATNPEFIGATNAIAAQARGLEPKIDVERIKVKKTEATAPSAQTKTATASAMPAENQSLQQPKLQPFPESFMLADKKQAQPPITPAAPPQDPQALGGGPEKTNAYIKPPQQGTTLSLAPKPQNFLQPPNNTGMENPIAFSPAPTASLEAPTKLMTLPQKQLQKDVIPEPKFDVGAKPNSAPSTAQPFSPGFSQQVGGLTKSFADIVKQAFAQTQENNATAAGPQSTEQQSQNPNQSTNSATTRMASQQGLQKKLAQQQPNNTGGFSTNSSSSAPRPTNSSSSGARRVTPISTVGSSGGYTVKKGDTLWAIAQKTLGSGARYKELGYGGDPKKLQVGAKLKIPRP